MMEDEDEDRDDDNDDGDYEEEEGWIVRITVVWRYCLFVWLFGFLTSLSTTRRYRGRVPRLTSDNFTCCHTRDRAGRP